MSRNGKIARCPRGVREQLNLRLQNGEQGETLLEWLNGLPEVKEMLDDYFAGMPVSKQNLSEWRQGGYEEWLQHQESCDFVRSLAEQGGDFIGARRGSEVSDWLAARLAVDLAQVSLKMLAETSDAKDRWQKLQEILPQLAVLRRHDHRAARLRRDQEIWERGDAEHEEALEAAEISKVKREALSPVWAMLERAPMAEIFGGGESGRWIADFIIAVNRDLPLPKPQDCACFSNQESKDSDVFDSGRTQSDPVKPSQTKKNGDAANFQVESVSEAG